MATRRKKSIDALVAELGLDPDVGPSEYDYDAYKRDLRGGSTPAPDAPSRKPAKRKFGQGEGGSWSWFFESKLASGVEPGARWRVMHGEATVLSGVVRNRDVRDGRILLVLDAHCREAVSQWVDSNGPREALTLRTETGDAVADAATLRLHHAVIPMPGDDVVVSFEHA